MIKEADERNSFGRLQRRYGQVFPFFHFLFALKNNSFNRRWRRWRRCWCNSLFNDRSDTFALAINSISQRRLTAEMQLQWFVAPQFKVNFKYSTILIDWLLIITSKAATPNFFKDSGHFSSISAKLVRKWLKRHLFELKEIESNKTSLKMQNNFKNFGHFSSISSQISSKIIEKAKKFEGFWSVLHLKWFQSHFFCDLNN